MRRFTIKTVSLTFIILGILLMPISPVLEKGNGNLKIEFKINKSFADNVKVGLDIIKNVDTSKEGQVSINVTINSADGKTSIQDYRHLDVLLYNISSSQAVPSTNNLPDLHLEQDVPNDSDNGNKPLLTFSHTFTFQTTKDQKYYYYIVGTDGVWEPYIHPYSEVIKTVEDTPLSYLDGSFTASTTNNSDTTISNSNDVGNYYGCNANPRTWFTNCLALTFYTIIFQPLAAFSELAAKILDFFVYYSTNSSAYSSSFVSQGWKAVRDIANIFFIIALLYIAIKTILDLNVSDNKRLISAIIIIALLINFSLFFTQVIIDGTNILAKVFYNQISSVDKDGHPLRAGNEGEKSVSVGLVAKFNPHNIVGTDVSGQIGQFVFVTFLCILMCCFMIYVFISVALLFVGRVVALWISMIFAPVAFASYSFKGKIPGIGHQDWWDELLKNAFLAPIFIFFLYIIILFGDFFNLITYDVQNSTGWLESVMKTIIPFAIVFVLLIKARGLAIKFSGEIGRAINKGAMAVGGFVGGAALGAAAMVGTSTVGLGASRLLRSGAGQRLQEASEKKGLAGFFYRGALKATTKAGTGTFDLRKTGVASLAGMGGFNLNKGTQTIGLGVKKGGFEGVIERRDKKAAEEFENHKTRMTDDEVKAWVDKRKTAGARFLNPDGTEATINNADQLNSYRMKKFNDNLGKTGFISSMAYSAVKTRTKDGEQKLKQQAISSLKTANAGNTNYNPTEAEIEQEKNKILDEKAKKVKMGIGIGVAAVAGGLGGLAGASVIGGLAAPAVGAVGGAGAVGVEGAKLVEEERGARAIFGKQMKTLQNIEDRLKNLSESLESHYELLERGNAISKDENGKSIEFVKGNRDAGFSVDSTAVEKALANLAIIAKSQNLELKKFVEKGEGNSIQAGALKKAMLENVLESATLNKLKTSVKEVTNIENQIYNTKRDKTREGKKDDSGPKPAPSSPASPAGGGKK